MTKVKRNPREPIPSQSDSGYIVQRYESKDILPGFRDWRCEATPVRVLKSKEEVKDVHGNVMNYRAISWAVTPYKTRAVHLGEIINLMDRRTIDDLVKAGLGEIVTPENTKKAEKLNKQSTENKQA
jgi:hypothetical protein